MAQFAAKGGVSDDFLELLNEMMITAYGQVETVTLVERARLDQVIDEQELSLSEMMDTGKALKIGRLLTADYIATGSVIEMSRSVIVFGRIINTETGVVESAAQVILSKTDKDMAGFL